MLTPSRRDVVAGGLAATASLVSAPLSATSPQSESAILRRAYTLLHPGLLRYATARQVEDRLSRLARAWDATPTLGARYLALSRFAGTVRCGHSYANFYNQKKVVQTELFAGRNRLPFRFSWLGEAMVVTADPSGTLPRGTMIESIDERAARDVLRALLPLTRADGSNDAKRRQLLSVAGIDDYETFDIYYPLVFPTGERFAIRARGPDGKAIVTDMAAIDLTARRAERPTVDRPDPDAPAWTIEHRAKTAILTMDSWGLYNSKWDWRGWLATTFEDLARLGTTKLVIDIRRNEGGLDCGHEIIARLIDAPIMLDDYVRRVRYTRVPDDLLPYLDTWDPSFRDWGKDAVRVDDRFYDLKRDNGDNAIKPKGSRFLGNVVVLTGAENSSATFQFAELIRKHRLGLLIGEPTGGNQRGINGGAFFFLRLPQSGLEIDLPLIGTFPKSKVPDAGIVPDRIVPRTAQDIATDRDRALETALAA